MTVVTAGLPLDDGDEVVTAADDGGFGSGGDDRGYDGLVLGRR